jgi:hypothetical protein
VKKDFIDQDKWMLKREFHFKDEVMVSDLQALLWPLDTGYDQTTRSTIINPVTFNEIAEFTFKNPDVPVFQYLWTADEAEERFTYSSYAISRELYDTGVLPTAKAFKADFLYQFPSPPF